MKRPTGLSPLLKLSLIPAIAALAAVLIFAWQRTDDNGAPPVTEHEFESGRIVWSINAYPAKVLQGNTFTVSVTDQSGKPLEGARLSVKLDMLHMICGDMDFDMTEITPGRYTGVGIPLMAGTWKATLTLEAGEDTYKVARLLQAVRA